MLSLLYCKLYHGLYLLFLCRAAVKRGANRQFMFDSYAIEFCDENK